jgi:sulfite exporter TauE/SafE
VTLSFAVCALTLTRLNRRRHAVAAFGVTAAANYALSGFVDWRLAAIFIGGGVLGDIAGAQLAATLGRTRGRLNIAFAAVIFAVAIYMLSRWLVRSLSKINDGSLTARSCRSRSAICLLSSSPCAR